TAPFKWTGKNPTLKRQCGPRFAMVLTRADPMVGRELDDLVAYMRQIPTTPPDPNAGLVAGVPTGGAARGKAIFERAVMKDGTPIPASGRCITCHPPPNYGSRLVSDVGTRGPRDRTGRFDTPHLTGVGSKAPYLHDGRARTLEEIWTLPGVGDKHGVVSDLTKADLSDLVEFLKGL
ncbi:MAG: di-heme oxidoredictase family protein, partial [Planctomycetota bacterium]|nr:di-heme oxidoredictase family protein [Planctomycetota bacterium]